MTKSEERERRRSEMLGRLFFGTNPDELAGDLRQAAFAMAIGLLREVQKDGVGIADSDMSALYSLTTLVDLLYEIVDAEALEDRAELLSLRRTH